MSFSRLALVALVAGASAFAINANAQSAAPSTNDAAAAAATAAPAAPAAAAHHRHHANTIAAARIDLNSADQATLAKIRAIGNKKAAMIIAYRSKNGAFTSIDDLKNLKTAKGKPLFSSKAIANLNKRLIIADASQGSASANAGQTSQQ